MQQRNKWLIAVIVVAALWPAACGQDVAEEEVSEPAKVEEHDSGLASVKLSEEGVHRLDLKTAAVRSLGGHRFEIPYGAVLYDPEGKTYAFTEPRPLTFIRRPIEIESIDGNSVVLTDGPPPGTKVVRVGAPELYGAETGVEE